MMESVVGLGEGPDCSFKKNIQESKIMFVKKTKTWHVQVATDLIRVVNELPVIIFCLQTRS